MNRSTTKYIHDILGTFWTRVFKDTKAVEWVSECLADAGSIVSGAAVKAVNSKTIHKEHPVKDTIENIMVPVSECLINVRCIGDGGDLGEDLIKPPANVPCMLIPLSTDYDIIQDAVRCPTKVWIMDINMSRKGKYICLYTDKVPDTVIVNKGGEPTAYFSLYGIRRSMLTDNDSDFGPLIGVTLKGCSQQQAGLLWDTYTRGMTTARLNTLVTGCLSENAAKTDGIVTDVFKERNCWYVIVGNHIHRGVDVPVVKKGDTVLLGDLLFHSVVVYTRGKTPGPIEVPAITVNTAIGPGIVRNMDQPVETTSGGHTVLPIDAPNYAATVDSYYMGNPGAPEVLDTFVASVNPLKHIMGVLRRNTLSVVVLRAADRLIPSYVKTVVAVIRRAILKSSEILFIEHAPVAPNDAIVVTSTGIGFIQGAGASAMPTISISVKGRTI